MPGVVFNLIVITIHVNKSIIMNKYVLLWLLKILVDKWPMRRQIGGIISRILANLHFFINIYRSLFITTGQSIISALLANLEYLSIFIST